MGERMQRTCPDCGGKMVEKTISRTFDNNGKKVKFNGINALVCEKCGEVAYTYAEAKRVQDIIGAVNICRTNS